MKITSMIINILLLISLTGCTGSNTSEKIVTGTIYISGNEPFTYLALKSDDDKYYKLDYNDELKKELWTMQGQVVKLEYSDIIDTEQGQVAKIIKILKEK